jgi:hypothetical protein
MGTPVVDALQNVLTKGLDAVESVKLAQLRVNDPTGYTVGPNGQRVPVGQPAGGFTNALATIPPLAWVAVIGVVGVAVLLPLLRR